MIEPSTGSTFLRWIIAFRMKPHALGGASYSISMTRLYLRVSVLMILMAIAATPQDPIIKVAVNLVDVLFNVRGKNNALIGNLEKKDFRIFEDGKEQEIKSFTRETDLPLTIGLLVDVSGSQERLIDIERRAA